MTREHAEMLWFSEDSIMGPVANEANSLEALSEADEGMLQLHGSTLGESWTYFANGVAAASRVR